MADEEEDKDKHLKQLDRQHKQDQKAQDEHLKQLNKEHKINQDEDLKHYKQLDRDYKAKIDLEYKIEHMNVSFGGARNMFLLDCRSVKDQLSEINQCSGPELGRAVHDYLTSRQHGWDRAGSGVEHAGFGDNQSR